MSMSSSCYGKNVICNLSNTGMCELRMTVKQLNCVFVTAIVCSHVICAHTQDNKSFVLSWPLVIKAASFHGDLFGHQDKSETIFVDIAVLTRDIIN